MLKILTANQFVQVLTYIISNKKCKFLLDLFFLI